MSLYLQSRPSDGDELVLAGSYADLFRMFQTELPVGVRMEDVELVFSAEVFVGMGFLQFAAGKGGGGHHHVRAGLVEGHGVK